jgi:heme oxygenase
MQQKLLEALRKQAKQLHNVLDKYVKQVQEFAERFPDRAHPIIIDYNTLMQIDSDDAFWNDGLFTNQNKPWDVDPNTQKGI